MIKKRDEYIASCSNAFRESKENRWSQELKHQYEIAKAELESFSGFARKEIERVTAIREKMFAVTLENFRILSADYAAKTSKSLKTAAMTPVDGGLESVPGVRIRQKRQGEGKKGKGQEEGNEGRRMEESGKQKRADDMDRRGAADDEDDEDNAFTSPYSIGDD